jgi:uncharacterized protein (DUF697 family)
MGKYMETLERVMAGDFDEATDEERREAVREVIQVCSLASSAVTIQPFPLLDVALITPIQIAMVQGIGRVHGHELDRKSVLEILTTLGTSIVAQNAMMAAAKCIPVLGWLMTLSMAYALTYAIGEVSDHYFRHGRGVDPDDMRSMFRKVYDEKKAEKERAHRSDSELKRKLKLLEQLRADGLLDEDEFQAKKETLLEDF